MPYRSILLILRFLLLFLFVETHDDLLLVLSLIPWKYELTDEPVFANRHIWLFNEIIEFPVIFLVDIIIIIFFILIILQVLFVSSSVVALRVFTFSTTFFSLEHILFAFTFFLSMLVVQLF